MSCAPCCDAPQDAGGRAARPCSPPDSSTGRAWGGGSPMLWQVLSELHTHHHRMSQGPFQVVAVPPSDLHSLPGWLAAALHQAPTTPLRAGSAHPQFSSGGTEAQRGTLSCFASGSQSGSSLACELTVPCSPQPGSRLACFGREGHAHPTCLARQRPGCYSGPTGKLGLGGETGAGRFKTNFSHLRRKQACDLWAGCQTP